MRGYPKATALTAAECTHHLMNANAGTTNNMGTNDTFHELQSDLPEISLHDYRTKYTELARQVVEEGNHMTPEAMHAAIFVAHNTHNQPKEQ